MENILTSGMYNLGNLSIPVLITTDNETKISEESISRIFGLNNNIIQITLNQNMEHCLTNKLKDCLDKTITLTGIGGEETLYYDISIIGHLCETYHIALLNHIVLNEQQYIVANYGINTISSRTIPNN